MQCPGTPAAASRPPPTVTVRKVDADRCLYTDAPVHTATMTSGHRWIAIVALCAGCWAMASAVNTWLDQRNLNGGWFNYAPNNTTVFSPAPASPWRGLLVWLVAIVVWSCLSYLVFRRAENHQ